MIRLVKVVFFFSTSALCTFTHTAHVYLASTRKQISAHFLSKPVSFPLTTSPFLRVKYFVLQRLMCMHPCSYSLDLWRSDVHKMIGRWESFDVGDIWLVLKRQIGLKKPHIPNISFKLLGT